MEEDFIPDVSVRPKDHNTVVRYRKLVRRIDKLKNDRLVLLKAILEYPIHEVEITKELERVSQKIARWKLERDQIIYTLGLSKLNDLIELVTIQRNLRRQEQFLESSVDTETHATQRSHQDREEIFSEEKGDQFPIPRLQEKELPRKRQSVPI